MPESSKRRRSRSRAGATRTEKSASSSTLTPRSVLGQTLEAWDQFARETGATATEFLRRFSQEQQKAYSAWFHALSEPSRRVTQPSDRDAVRSRFEAWNRTTEEIDRTVRDALAASMQPQGELMERWLASLAPRRPAPPTVRPSRSDEPPSEARSVTPDAPSPARNGRRWIESHL